MDDLHDKLKNVISTKLFEKQSKEKLEREIAKRKKLIERQLNEELIAKAKQGELEREMELRAIERERRKVQLQQEMVILNKHLKFVMPKIIEYFSENPWDKLDIKPTTFCNQRPYEQDPYYKNRAYSYKKSPGDFEIIGAEYLNRNKEFYISGDLEKFGLGSKMKVAISDIFCEVLKKEIVIDPDDDDAMWWCVLDISHNMVIFRGNIFRSSSRSAETKLIVAKLHDGKMSFQLSWQDSSRPRFADWEGNLCLIGYIGDNSGKIVYTYKNGNFVHYDGVEYKVLGGVDSNSRSLPYFEKGKSLPLGDHRRVVALDRWTYERQSYYPTDEYPIIFSKLNNYEKVFAMAYYPNLSNPVILSTLTEHFSSAGLKLELGNFFDEESTAKGENKWGFQTGMKKYEYWFLGSTYSNFKCYYSLSIKNET